MSSNENEARKFGYNFVKGPQVLPLLNLNKDEEILCEFNNAENLLNKTDVINTLSVTYEPTNDISLNSAFDSNQTSLGLQFFEQGEVSSSAYLFLLAEFIKMVVVDCEELEDHDKKLREIGEDVGYKLLELVKFKHTIPAASNPSAGTSEKLSSYTHTKSSKNNSSLDIAQIPKSADIYKYIVSTTSNSNKNLQTSATSLRDLQKLSLLEFVHGSLWKYMFGKKADDIQQLKNNALEYIIIDNNPLISSLILTSQINEFICGIIKSVVVNSGFDCDTVVAHVMKKDDPDWPNKTVYVVKFNS